MKSEKGQSLIELIIAAVIFVLTIGGLALFVLDSYLSGRLSSELTVANFLAEEGIEATRALRDNSWRNLTAGNHGLVIANNKWVFQGVEEDIGNELNGGKRIINIEDIDLNRKKITSQVSWQFSGGRAEEVKLVSYLTNWQRGFEIRKPTGYTDLPKKTLKAANAFDYPDGNTWATTTYNDTANPSILFHTWELPTRPYISLVLKYRYHADGARDDKYAVAYSITGCNGTFTNLISLTSAVAPDTTISVNLSPDQDFSQLCLKVYSQITGKADTPPPYLYTRDIWTEGTY